MGLSEKLKEAIGGPPDPNKGTGKELAGQLDWNLKSLTLALGLSAQLKGALAEGTSLEVMVKEAARWKGASMKAARLVQDDKRLALKLMRMTTKGDLDAYLMKKFDLENMADARDVSNHLTHHNVPADEKAELKDFAKEPWAKLALSKK